MSPDDQDPGQAYQDSSFDRESNITPGMFAGPPADSQPMSDTLRFALDNPEMMGGGQASAATGGRSVTDDPEYQRLTAEGKELRGERRAFTDRVLEGMESDRKELGAMKPPALTPAPQAPSKERIAQGAMAWMQIATALGALAGGFGRRNSTAALNAFGGAIKGFTQGNIQAYETSVEEWKAASEQVKTDNQAKIDQYELILRNKKMDMDQKMSMIKIAAAQYDDEIAYNLAERKDYTTLAMTLEKENMLMKQYEDKHNLMKAQLDKVEMQIRLGQYGGGTGQRMALQAFMQEYYQKNGHPPSSDEIIAFNNKFVGGQAGSRALGTTAGRFSGILETLDAQIEGAKAASAGVPRNLKFSKLNQLEVQLKASANDPKAVEFLMTNLNIAENWAKAMNVNGVMRESDREKALSILNAGLSHGTYSHALDTLRAIVQRERGGVQKALGNVEGGQTQGAAPAPDTAAPPAQKQIFFDAQGNRVQAPAQ